MNGKTQQNEDGRNRRASPRVEVDLDVAVRVQGERGRFIGRLRNLSLGGAFIEMLEPLPETMWVDARVDLAIAGVAVEQVSCHARVVWAWLKDVPDDSGLRRRGVGVAFSRLRPATRVQLEEYIGARLPPERAGA